MNEETIGILLAGIALAAFLYLTRNRASSQATTASPSVESLAQVFTSSEVSQGPSYFIANQPYYFAPPVGNIMPPATASNTTATNIAMNDDGGCGCS